MSESLATRLTSLLSLNSWYLFIERHVRDCHRVRIQMSEIEIYLPSNTSRKPDPGSRCDHYVARISLYAHICVQSCIKFKKFRSSSAYRHYRREKLKLQFMVISELELSIKPRVSWCELKLMVRSQRVQCPFIEKKEKHVKTLIYASLP